MTMADSGSSGLKIERDFLLRSLRDLDAEFAAGDIDRQDYEQLKDSYTARAAAVLRALESPASGNGAGARPPAGPQRRRLVWIGALTVAGLVAGWALAQAAGERGTEQLTGSIEDTLRDRVLTCQQIGADLTRLVESLECFDAVLDEDPQNVEALTYRGWYVVLASRSTGDPAIADELLASGMASLDKAIQISPNAPDARAFRTVAREQSGDETGACEDVGVLAAIDTPPMILGLVGPVAERLDCPLPAD
ncbi:MAG: hypothetical protein O3C27_03240 [Actinomycetota bacterium]|nr:hypothetical protein [Actinomycetota bacterium]